MHHIPANELKTCTVNPMLESECLLRGGNGLLIPAGSTAGSTVVTLSTFSLSEMQRRPSLTGFHPPTKIALGGFQTADSVYEIRPIGQVLKVPVTAQFRYDPAGAAPAAGARRAPAPNSCTPRMFFWKEAQAQWNPIRSSYDVVSKLVSAPVSTLGIYAVACGPDTVDETLAATGLLARLPTGGGGEGCPTHGMATAGVIASTGRVDGLRKLPCGKQRVGSLLYVADGTTACCCAVAFRRVGCGWDHCRMRLSLIQQQCPCCGCCRAIATWA